MRLGGVAAQHREVDLGARLAAQQPLAFVDRGVARRLAVDGADVVAGHQARLRGRRAVARGDHAEVILARQLEAGLRGAAEIALVEHLDLVDVEIGAVRIEAVGEPVHRAVHHLVDVHFLDVVVEDQRHDIFEDAQVLIAVFARASPCS